MTLGYRGRLLVVLEILLLMVYLFFDTSENCREAFIESGVLNALIALAEKSKDTTLLVCVSGALRNLSLSGFYQLYPFL